MKRDSHLEFLAIHPQFDTIKTEDRLDNMDLGDIKSKVEWATETEA